MTAPVLTPSAAAPGAPDATRCPQCRALLTSREACASCDLPLHGPAAARLWEVDVELARLDARRAPLLAERARLLAALRGQGAVGAAAPAPAAAAVSPAAEWTPQRVQNALLGLGGLLLAVAALVFAAVTYDRLGAGGRSAVLLALTLAAAAAAPYALRRGLTSTAETLVGVALVLAALDAYGLWTLGVAGDLSGPRYSALSAAVLAAVAAGAASLLPLRVPRLVAVLLAQLPVPLLVLDGSGEPATVATALAGLAAADLVLVARLRARDARGLAAGCAAGAVGIALLAGALATFGGAPGAGALALLACAVVLAAASALATGLPRTALAALPVLVLALAAVGLAAPELPDVQLPLVPAAVALVAVLAAAQLPRSQRTGPALGAVAAAAAAVAAVTDPALTGLLGPLSWLADPWSLTGDPSARGALLPVQAWSGTLVVPVVLAAAATVGVTAGLALQVRSALVTGAALGGAALVLLPLGLDLPYAAALPALVVLGAAAVLAPVPARLRLPAAVGGALPLLLAVAWSAADRTATLAVLPVVALLLAAAATRSAALAPAATGVAGLLAAAELGAGGAAAGLSADQTGGLLVLAVALLLAAAPQLRSARLGLEAAAAATAVAAVVLASGDAGWLSWTLAGLALAALAGALSPDRRRLAVVGGLLLSASSWVRLADAGVTDPEPYVVPLALVALVLGHLRRRREPGTASFAAYGPGLTALLVPSLLAAYAGSPLLRPLLLGAVALVVVLLGARERLQAPLAVGGAVLVLDALLLLAPYAAAAPRWLALGAAGTLLVAVGATYEQRLRDLAGLRSRYDALD